MTGKALAQQAREAYKALEQEKDIFTRQCRVNANNALRRIVAFAEDESLKRDEKLGGKYLAANIWLIEYAYGKASQKVEHTGNEDEPIRLKVIVETRES